MEKSINSEIEKEQINFYPPLYIQRDMKILEFINNNKDIESVVDLGCAECRLIKKLKECTHLKFICGIDIERNLLQDNTHSLEPLPWNFMFPRFDPLEIVILHGSMLEPDEIMFGCDMVILSEVIEHLVAEDLEVLPDIVFDSLRPRTCIMTTPNSEFNVVFGNEFHGFRHPDHKFEWSRNEFSEWCHSITQKYPYSVSFDGVGDPPLSHPDVGFCSQIAIFRCLTSPKESVYADAEIKTASHVRIAEFNYPYVDQTAWNRKRAVTRIYSILESETSMLRYMEEPPYQPEGNNSWLHDESASCVPLEMLLQDNTLKNCFKDVADLRNFLKENNIKLHKDDEFVEYRFGASNSEDEDENQYED